MRCLIADDHLLFAEGFALLIAQLFPQSECMTTHSFQGLQAHPALLHLDLLFVDWHMPGMQGIASVRWLQYQYPGLPICIISADDSRLLMSHVLQTGVSGFIPKSIRADQLHYAINRVLAGEVYSSLSARPQVMLADSLTEVGRTPTTLTPRQTEILALMVDGSPNKLISRQLGIQESTLKTHMKAIFKLLAARNRTDAVNKARLLGLLD